MAEPLHRPVVGYRFCPHEADEVDCPPDTCVFITQTTIGGVDVMTTWALPVLVCLHCVIGPAGADLPPGFFHDDVGWVYWQQQEYESSRDWDYWHRIWPCPTAAAVAEGHSISA